MKLAGQSRRQSRPLGLIAWKSQPQPSLLMREGARPYPCTRQSLLCEIGVAGLVKPKQRRSPDQGPAEARHLRVKPQTLAFQTRRCGPRPFAIEQRATPDFNRRARDRPWSRQASKRGDIGFVSEDEAEPQSGEPEELSERSQDQKPRLPRVGRERQTGNSVSKTLVNHQAADLRQKRKKLARLISLAVGVVGIGEHRDISARERVEIRGLGDLPARGG